MTSEPGLRERWSSPCTAKISRTATSLVWLISLQGSVNQRTSNRETRLQLGPEGCPHLLVYATAARAPRYTSAGIGRRNRHVIAIGRSPSCDT